MTIKPWKKTVFKYKSNAVLHGFDIKSKNIPVNTISVFSGEGESFMFIDCIHDIKSYGASKPEVGSVIFLSLSFLRHQASDKYNETYALADAGIMYDSLHNLVGLRC